MRRSFPTVQELEEQIERREVAHARARRVRHVRLRFVCAALLSAALGFALGVASRQSARELTEAVHAQRRRDAAISHEVNRTLLELWKMEDFESARNQGRAR